MIYKRTERRVLFINALFLHLHSYQMLLCIQTFHIGSQKQIVLNLNETAQAKPGGKNETKLQ